MAKPQLTIDPSVFDPGAADKDLTALNASIIEAQKAQPSMWSMPVETMRRLRKEGKGTFPAAPRDRAAQTMFHTSGSGRDIAIRVIRPSNGATRGTYLHMHGGGWVFGGSEEADPRHRRFAENTGLTVASVEYRLAPEHPFPAAPDDCAGVAVALANGHLDLPRGYLAIGGESAGAHLAALTLIRLRDEYGMQPYRCANLVAGAYDLSLTPSVRAQGSDRLILDTDDVKEFVLRFVPDTFSLKDPKVSPLYADLSGLPPALFSVGTADLLLDDTLFMATRWQAAGNETHLSITNGGCHVFQSFPTESGQRSLTEMEDFIKVQMASPL